MCDNGNALRSHERAQMTGEDRNKRVLSTLLAELPDPVLALDLATMRVVDASRGAFGYSKEELAALDAFALFPRWWNAEKGLDPGTSVATLCRAKDGTSTPVEIHFTRAHAEGLDLLLAAVRARG